jgi:hypothetical protein
MEAGETPGPSGIRPDWYLDDISEDELSASAPADETTDDNNARRECNKKWNERRRCLRETLPIRNLSETLDQVANRVHFTPEQCLMFGYKISHDGRVAARIVRTAAYSTA